MNAQRKRQNSGQVLVVTALLVTLLLLSAALYVSETEKAVPSNTDGLSNLFEVCKLGATHAVVSALANISNGGNVNVLVDDLNSFKSAFINHSYDAIVQLNANPLDVSPYVNGAWVSWGQNGEGISSAYVDFALNCSGLSSTTSSEYSVNITSAISIAGQYTTVNGSLKQTNVICNLLNEGKPALARNFTVYYEDDGSLVTEEWLKVQTPSIIDYGNGTYSLSFVAETLNPDNPLIVSVCCHDTRSILVQANVTCVES